MVHSCFHPQVLPARVAQHRHGLFGRSAVQVLLEFFEIRTTSVVGRANELLHTCKVLPGHDGVDLSSNGTPYHCCPLKPHVREYVPPGSFRTDSKSFLREFSRIHQAGGHRRPGDVSLLEGNVKELQSPTLFVNNVVLLEPVDGFSQSAFGDSDPLTQDVK